MDTHLKLATLAREPDEATLRNRLGDAYLIIGGRGGRQLGQLQTAIANDGARPAADLLIVALAGRKPPITIGRAKNSDVVVDDASISTFHAALVQHGGAWAVHDGGSRNGTLVDGQSAPQRGAGDPLPVRPGSIVRTGSVELTFVDAALALKLARFEAGTA